jgi:hypothetical protein
MSSLTHVTDHGEDAASKLLEQFKDKPRILALLQSYVTQIQALEDVFWDMFTKRWIDGGEGVQLDVVGRIVGEKRQGSEDEEYRAFLRARIRVNRSVGLMADMVKIVALIQGDDLPVAAWEYFPHAIRLEPEGAVTVDPVRVGRMLADAKPGGVALSFVYSMAERANTFLFADVDGGFAPTDAQSFGDYESDPIGGGVLSGAAP